MATSKITLIGMYNFLQESGEDLFLHLDLPTGIDKDVVKDNILMRGGEFEVLYSDPYFLRNSMLSWSKKWHWTFKKWLDLINMEYNPIENYDRYEEGSEHQTDEGRNSSNRNDTRTDNLKEQTTGSDSGTSENTVSAFDASTYQPKDKTETATNNSMSVENTGTQSQTGTINGTNNNNMNRTHNLHIHGNIGVRSSQELAFQEIDLAMFNLYDRITDVFLQEYIIPIY